MFIYAQAPALQRLLEGGIEGAEVDDWLEGWTIGTLHTLLQGKWPPRVLDIELGENPRLYRKAAASAGCTVTHCSPDRLDALSQGFDLVLALSFERGECLAPVDPDNPYRQAELLGKAARQLAPGGLLVWSYLYAYPENETLHSLLEPAALFHSMTLRGLVPLDYGTGAREKVRIYHDPETLFVGQKAVLAHSDRQRRIVRVLGAVRSPSPSPPPPPPPPELPEPVPHVAEPEPKTPSLLARIFGRR